MKVGRAKRVIFVVAALLSLFASTLAACGCSHHQTAAEPVEVSCHGASHQTPETVDQTGFGDTIETGCVCLVQEPGPSLSSKSRVPTDSSNKALVERHTLEAQRVPIANSAETPNYHTLIAPYDSCYGTRAPARAPPLL